MFTLSYFWLIHTKRTVLKFRGILDHVLFFTGNNPRVRRGFWFTVIYTNHGITCVERSTHRMTWKML